MVAGNTWKWADGSAVAMQSDQWYDGHPADGACTVVTNYMYWDVTKFMLSGYEWRSFSCDFNVGKAIQGYICEGIQLINLVTCTMKEIFSFETTEAKV